MNNRKKKKHIPSGQTAKSLTKLRQSEALLDDKWKPARKTRMQGIYAWFVSPLIGFALSDSMLSVANFKTSIADFIHSKNITNPTVNFSYKVDFNGPKICDALFTEVKRTPYLLNCEDDSSVFQSHIKPIIILFAVFGLLYAFLALRRVREYTGTDFRIRLDESLVLNVTEDEKTLVTDSLNDAKHALELQELPSRSFQFSAGSNNIVVKNATQFVSETKNQLENEYKKMRTRGNKLTKTLRKMGVFAELGNEARNPIFKVMLEYLDCPEELNPKPFFQCR